MTLLEALNKLDPSAADSIMTSAFETASVGLGVVDRDLRIVWLNDALGRLYGWEKDHVVGCLISDVIGEDAYHERCSHLRQALSGVEVIDATVQRPALGSITDGQYAKTSYYPIRPQAGVVGVLLIVIDQMSDLESQNKIVHQAFLDLQKSEQDKSDLLAKIRGLAVMQASFLRDVLASVTDGKLRLCHNPAHLPPKGTPVDGVVSLSAVAGLWELRHEARNAATRVGFTTDRWQDLITAVSEAGMNAIVHAGGGTGTVFHCSGACIQVWIEDKGTGIDLENLPRATLEKGYTTKGTMGHGMKLMLQTADRVWLLTGPGGTTVVLEQDREAVRREWA